MKRRIFEAEHDDFRSSVRSYIERSVLPNAQRWDEEKAVDDAAWLEAGQRGFLGFAVPEEYGGAGSRDYRFNVVLSEEFSKAGVTSSGMGYCLHNDTVLPYLTDLTTPEQKARWLPAMVTGECRGAIAMTEPGTGSDLSGIRTSAEKTSTGYRVNGSKTFISNGQHAGLIVTVVRTGEHPHRGLSLLGIDGNTPGLVRGRNLQKVGLHSQDTSELSFQDVEVPKENLLGEEGEGFAYLLRNLPQERLCISVTAVASARAALSWTVDYVKSRSAFGRTVGSFQNTRFVLADVAIRVQAAEVLLDRSIEEHLAGELTAVDAAALKAHTTELLNEVVGQCLQLHGGYGYMLEYPIARSYLDARVQTIYGGTTEIMKEIVARDLGI